jgi:hypothetical protein
MSRSLGIGGLFEMDEARMTKAPGRAEYRRHLKKDRLTRGQSIKAFCYECSGYYADGVVGCEMPNCPLYSYNPVANRDSARPIKEINHVGKGRPLIKTDEVLMERGDGLSHNNKSQLVMK